MADQLITELIVDAKLANQGAQEYERAMRRVEQSSARATASVDRLGQSVDRAGQRMRDGGAAGVIAGAPDSLQRPATTAPASLEEFNSPYKQTIRLEQAGAFSVVESQARYAAHRGEIGRLEAEQHASIGRVRFPEADFGRSVAPFAVAAAAGNDQLVTQVGRELDALRPDSHLQRAARAVTQAERNDPTTQRTMAEMRASQSAVGPVAATALGSSVPAGVAEGAALVPVLTRLSTAIERLTVWEVERVPPVLASSHTVGGSSLAEDAALAPVMREFSAAIDRFDAVINRMVAATAGSPAAAPASASTSSPAVAPATTPPPASQPAAPITDIESKSSRSLPQLPLSDYEKSRGEIAEGEAIPAAAAESSRTLPQLPLSDYEKALEKGPAAVAAYTAGLRGVSAVARSSAGDFHGAADATEKLAGAMGHVSGAGGRVREGFVIIRELLAGNFTRLIGSATIELQRFGALGILLNPVTLGIGATVGAMTLLVRRSADIDANIRSFDATLRTMGTSSQASGAGLEKTTEELKHLGISADDAKKSIDAVIRAPGISPAAVPQISQIGVRVSQYAGGDPGQRVEELTKATRGGVEGLIKYGEQYNAFSRDQINTFRELERAGQGQLAVTQALDALDHHLPHTQDLLSDFQLSTQKLRNSWDDLLTSLSKTPAVEGTISAITKVTEAAATPTGLGAIGGAALGTVALAALGPRAGIGRLAAIPTGLALGGAIGAAGEGGENPLSRNISAGATIGGLLGAASPLGPIAGSLVGGTGGAILAGVATVIIQGAQKVEWAEGGNKIAEFLRSLKPTGSPGLEFPDEAVRQLAEAVHGQTEATNKNTEALHAPGGQTSSEASTRSEADRVLGGLPQSSTDERFDRLGHVSSGLGQRLIESVIRSESGGNPLAESPTGALGIMQVKLPTAQEIVPGVTREQLFNPNINQAIGTEYLRQQIEAFGSVFRGLEAYNAGPGAVQRESRGTRNLPPEVSAYAENIIRRVPGLTGKEGLEAAGLGRSASPPTVPTTTQQGEVDEEARRQRENLEVEKENPGFARERAQAALEQERRAREQFPGLSEVQNQSNAQAQTAFDQTLAIRAQKERELAQLRIQLEREVAQASAHSWEEGLQARAHMEAVLTQRERGGEVPAIQRDTLRLEAQQAITAGEAEIKRADTRVRAEQIIAGASQISRAATIQATIATQAYEFAEEAARKAGASRVGTLEQEAAALAREKAQQLQSIEAYREAIEAGSQLQHGRNELQAVGLRSSLVGQSGIEADRQLSLLRTEQELRDRYSQAKPEVRAAIGQQGIDFANANAQLAETEQHQRRIDELFHGIANTVDNELGTALKNALIRTPLEAGEHIKNYWRDLRASLKSTLADIVSGIAETAFIKPVTSTIASGLGLGKVAQEIGGFATGGDTVVGGSGGTDSQLVQFMATPGERVIVLTPPQAQQADKTGKLPHFATGGELDPSTGEVTQYASDGSALPEAMRSYSAMTNEITVDPLVDEYGRPKAGISEFARFPQPGTVDQSQIGDPVIASPRMRPDLAMPSPNSSPDLRPHSTTEHPYLNISYGRRTPHFATGGEYDVSSGDVSNYSEEGAAPSLYDYWQKNVGDDPAALGVLEKISKNEGTYGDASYNTLFGGQKFEGDQFPQWQGMRGPWGITHAAGAYQFQPRTYNAEQKRLGLPDFSKWSQDAAAWDLALRTYNAKTGRDLRGDWQQSQVDYNALSGQWASFKSKRPHFAGGGELDPATNEVVYYNDAGQPFTVPGDKSTPSGLSDSPSGIGQSLVDLARGGLRGEADFLSAKAADQPLLGLNRDTGEITGRIPALADFMQQGLAGGAPAGTLSSGMRLGRAASAAEDIASVESIPHTRLYRVEVPAEARVTPPDWIAQGLDINGTKDARDRWFTATPDHLEWYRKDIGVDSITSYVDVPTAQAEQYRVSNQPREIQRFSLDPDNEFFVPREISNKRQPLAGDRVQPLPHVASAAEDVQAEQPTDGGLFNAAIPHFAGGGIYDPATGQTTYFNDAGQPFTVPGDKSTPSGLSDSPSGIGQGLVDLARGGLRSESDFLSTKAADQPLIGLNRDTGELTGRIPALADFMQQGLAGGAPAGTLSSGIKLGRAAGEVADVAGAEAAVSRPPIIAYHGSPHDFPAQTEIIDQTGQRQFFPLGGALPEEITRGVQSGELTVKEHPLGRFDQTKIGTGEGAQAYGHGLYFAESEGVARSYRDTLSPSGLNITTPSGATFSNRLPNWSFMLGDALKPIGGENYMRSAIAGTWFANPGEKISADAVFKRAFGAMNLGEQAEQARAEVERLTTAAQPILDQFKVQKPGNMYEVGIHADPESFIQWDKPLSEQSPQVQSAIKPFLSPDKTQALEIGKTRLDTGADLYNDIAQSPSAPVNVALKSIAAGHDPTTMLRAVFPQMDDTTLGATLTAARAFQSGGDAAASAALKEAGIPGIRYLDQGSRTSGEGTHNYVMFGDENIEILRKYGLAGPPSVSQQDQTQPLPHFAGGGTYDPATGRTQYFNDAGQPFSLPSDRTTPDAPIRDGFFGALPALANAGLKDYGEFVSGAKTAGQPFLGFDREKMEFTGRLPVLGDFLAANVIDANVGAKVSAQTLRELHVNTDLQGKLADRMAAYGGLYETGENAPQPALESSAGEPEARAAIPEAQAAIPPPLPPGSAMLEPAYSGRFDVIPPLAEGGSILQTGAALVHAGEIVLPTEKTDEALRAVTTGLQGFSAVLGQATPGLQTLGRAASELSALGNIAHAVGNFILPSANAAPISTALGGGGLTNSQLTFNVNGVSSGGTITGPAQGGTVNSNGNVITTIGGAAAPAVTPPQAAAVPAASSSPGATTTTAVETARRIVENAQPATSGSGPTSIDLGPADFSSGSLATQPASSSSGGGGPSVIDVLGPADFSSGSLAPQETSPLSAGAATAAGITRQQEQNAAAAPASTSPFSASNLAAAASGLSLIDKLNGSFPGFLPSFLQSGSGSAVGSFLSNPFGLFASQVPAGQAIAQGLGPLAPNAAGNVTVPGLFGTTATFGSFLSGAGAGFGAGMLLNNALGGNPTGGTVGSAGGALAGAAIGSFLLPGAGTLVGGLIGGTAGGGLGGLIGGPPRGQSAGASVGANGQLTFQDTGGSQQNITASTQVAQQIGSFTRGLSQLTDAFGNAIGTVSSDAVVSSDNRKGLSVTGGNISGGTFGQNADEAVKETELQLIHGLANVTSDTLRTIFKNINDPSQVQNAVQFAAVYDRLNVTSEQLTASLNGNVNAVGPFQQALTQVKSTFTQLTSQAQQFGLSTAPITQALQTVTDTLNADFRINVAEALSTAIDGGNDFIASLVKIHQTYVQAASDAQSLSGVPAPATPPGFAHGGTTPAGWILVGEKGPEWMYQPGGATVLPNGVQPSDVPSPNGRSFAEGTIGLGDIAGQVPGIGSAISEAAGGPSLLGAAGGALGIGTDTLSTIGDVLPIAGPLIGGALAAVTGHPVQGAISATASLIGFELGGPIGGVIGGLVGLLGNLFGPKPSNRASGDVIDLASGTVSGFQSAGDSKADQEVQQVSEGISRITTSFQQATGGTLSGSLSVQDGRRDGLKTSYSGPLGHIDAKWGSVTDAIGQFGLAIAHNLQGIDPTLQAQLAGINDPNALIPAIEQFTGKSIDLSSSTPVAGPSAAGTDQSQAPAAASAASPASGGDAAAPEAAAPPAAAPAATGVVWAAPTTDPALLKIFPQLGIGPTVFSDAGAAGFANGGTTPAGWILVGERGPEWLFQPGGATVLPNGVQPADVPSPAGRSFADGTQDWGSFELTVPAGWSGVVTTDPATAAQWIKLGANVSPLGSSSHAGLQDYEVSVSREAQTTVGGTSSEAQQWSSSGATVATLSEPIPNAPATSTPAGAPNGTIGGTPVGQIYQAISGTETAQAAPVLAGLGTDQLTTVVQQLGQVAPEISTMAQDLINSGNALPDLITQGIEALTDPLEIAIQKEKALGAERVAAATATGQDLVKVEQLNSANLVQAVLNNLGNQNAINALTYPGNTKALETLQAAPALAQLSGQQLNAIVTSVWQVAPDLAALASGILQNNAALPDSITQELEGIVNPLQLALQQQAAQSAARNEVGQATGQDPNQVGALNTASVVQAVLQQISNPQALQALVYGHGNLQSLTALQGGQLLGGLGTDQLNAIISQIWQVAPQLSAMASGLLASGKALPDYLTQQIEAITESGVLAVQKASATGYEQVITAQATGQDVGKARQLGTAEVSQAVAQATNTQIPTNGLPDWLTQLEEASTAPLQLAIQKEQAAGAQRVAIAQATGDDLVRVQKVNADAIAQIWYQATQQLTSLRNDITSGSLSGLTPANQVTASVEHFNTVLGLVQGGNTNFIGELANAGQAAVQASQQAYGNGPQTASVREQVYQAISPLLVSASGYPTSGATAIAAGGSTSSLGAGVLSTGTSDLQANTVALQGLTAAVTNATPGAASGPLAGQGSPNAGSLTTNPVTGQSFTGTGITAVTPNFPSFPSASTLSGALSNAIASRATDSDWATINQAVQAGILDPTKQPGYALVIGQAEQWAAGQAINPSNGLSQALSDATKGTPSLQEWALINQAVNAGILSPVAQPQYATIIHQARQIASAQAVSLSQIPNNQTDYFAQINGLPRFAAGTESTPSGMILVGEKGPEAYHPANDNAPWRMVGVDGPELLNQPGGATILPFPVRPSQRFAEGTAARQGGRYAWANNDPKATADAIARAVEKLRTEVIVELKANRQQLLGGQMSDDQNAKIGHELTRQVVRNVGPQLSAPARRAVG